MLLCRAGYSQERPPTFVLRLTAGMAMSDLKVASKRDSRIQYRHIYEVSGGGSSNSKKRLWKWGSDSPVTFERFSKAIRACLDNLSEVSCAVAVMPHRPAV